MTIDNFQQMSNRIHKLQEECLNESGGCLNYVMHNYNNLRVEKFWTINYFMKSNKMKSHCEFIKQFDMKFDLVIQ